MIETIRNGGSRVQVTFRVSGESGARMACVVGEFNDWSTTTHPMQRDADGFVTTIALEADRSYRFRYLLDGERWENDWAAHGYVPNEFGGDDSLLDLRETPVANGTGATEAHGETGTTALVKAQDRTPGSVPRLHQP